MHQTGNVTAEPENPFSVEDCRDFPIVWIIVCTLFVIYLVVCPSFCCFVCIHSVCCGSCLPKSCYPQPYRVQPNLRSQNNAINGAAATNIHKTIDQKWCTISVLPNAIVEESSDETNSTREECVVCLGPQHPKGRLVPCGHASFCYQCSSRISVGQDPRCPLCRTPIQQANSEL